MKTFINMQQMIHSSWLKLLVNPAVPPTTLMDLSAPETERSDAFGNNFRVAAAFGQHIRQTKPDFR